jgi:hypothetical protein
MDHSQNSNIQMKQFIVLTEELLSHYATIVRPVEPEPIVETVEHVEHPILQECRDIVFKLRTFMEDASGGEYALGI